MKEFGNQQALKAELRCINTNCDLNDEVQKLRPIEEVVEEAKRHDKVSGHEGVVVKRDNGHPLTDIEGAKVLVATGWASF